MGRNPSNAVGPKVPSARGTAAHRGSGMSVFDGSLNQLEQSPRAT
jgi:hypothetical protein